MPDTPKDLHKKLLGRKGEDLVAKYLKKHGYKILHRNFTTPFGEADIVALKGDTTCFIEVKTRESDAFGLPVEAVDRAKKERYRKIAWYYCDLQRKELSCRFDVASVLNDEIEYFENAFI